MLEIQDAIDFDDLLFQKISIVGIPLVLLVCSFHLPKVGEMEIITSSQFLVFYLFQELEN